MNLLIYGQQGNYSITEKAMSLRYDIEQRSLINSVRIALRVFVILDLLVLDRNTIKSCYREGLRDNSSVSILQ